MLSTKGKSTPLCSSGEVHVPCIIIDRELRVMKDVALAQCSAESNTKGFDGNAGLVGKMSVVCNVRLRVHLYG